ncbi:hypothetical protein ES702_02187 [subsurface metagenome]
MGGEEHPPQYLRAWRKSKERKLNTAFWRNQYLVFFTYIYVKKTKEYEASVVYPLSTYGPIKKRLMGHTCKGDMRYGGPNHTFNCVVPNSQKYDSGPARLRRDRSLVLLTFLYIPLRGTIFALSPSSVSPWEKPKGALPLWTSRRENKSPLTPLF